MEGIQMSASTEHLEVVFTLEQAESFFDAVDVDIQCNISDEIFHTIMKGGKVILEGLVFIIPQQFQEKMKEWACNTNQVLWIKHDPASDFIEESYFSWVS